MQFVIQHEIKGRIRIRCRQKQMSFEQADTLQYHLEKLPFVKEAVVRERTGSVILMYEGDRGQVLEALQRFTYQDANVPVTYLENSGRALQAEYWDKIITKTMVHFAVGWLIPTPIRNVRTCLKSAAYLLSGIKYLLRRKLKVPVLDGTAIAVSLLRGDYKTAGSVMFLLEIGSLLEEWTHKKTVDDLARSMFVQIQKVWRLADGQEILVPVEDVVPGDMVMVRMGNVIPFDGEVRTGEALVNQASLTGEGEAVRKTRDNYVYAGTVVEEGELTIEVKEANGSSRFDRIVAMVEETEKMKSLLESRAEHLADRLVPYTFLGAGMTGLLTGNTVKAVSVLMVDFSCALKLAMPVAVLSAIKELQKYHVTVKGGKFLEAMAKADTIVFDKTGTLTKAQPTVVDVISFCDSSPDDMLRLSACLEEHFPHSMAKAVVHAAIERKLEHEEMHSRVNYIVAHGISTTVDGKQVIIGSRHFVFEDEGCTIPQGMEEQFGSLPEEYSHLYLAIEKELAAVVCVEDPLREEAYSIVSALKEAGIGKVVMMTGDSEKTAAAIARKTGVDEYYAEVLPEDKAGFIEEEKKKGRKVIMIGDGINDSPALAASDVGIAISDGAEITRQVADIMIEGSSLYELVTLKKISEALMKRIRYNYRCIVGFNSGLLGLGITGVISPTISALLHNTSTLTIGLRSMGRLYHRDQGE